MTTAGRVTARGAAGAGGRRPAATWAALALVCAVVVAGAVGTVACTIPQRAAPRDTGEPAGLEAPAALRLVVLPDDGIEPLFDFVDGAVRTLDAYVFDLRSASIERRIVEAARRGVRVRAIVEPNPFGHLTDVRDTMSRLRKAGVSVKPAGRPFTKTHAKALVADGARAWIGTANLIDKWDDRRDYAVITHQAGTVGALARVFEQDWLGTSSALRLPLAGSGVDPVSRLVVGPINARTETTAFISAARFSLYLEHDQIDDPAIISLLARRSRDGVDVRVVTNEDETGQAVERALRARAPDIQVRLLQHPTIHAKVAIADESRVLLGSQNLTRESLDSRREIGIVVDDASVVGDTLGTFRRDFEDLAGAPSLRDAVRGPVPPFLVGFAVGVLVPCGAAAIWLIVTKRI